MQLKKVATALFATWGPCPAGRSRL